MLFPEGNSFSDRVKVVNKYKVKSQYVDIMRGSPLGNPSSLHSRTRTQALNDFRQYLRKELKDPTSIVRIEMERLLDKIMAGETVRLGCCCKPKDCHGDIIREKLIAAAERRSRRKHGR